MICPKSLGKIKLCFHQGFEWCAVWAGKEDGIWIQTFLDSSSSKKSLVGVKSELVFTIS